MARSLDGLIHYLVDQIALFGQHGALPVDFVTHVKAYYDYPDEESQAQDSETAHPRSRITPNIDRPFLEQVWKWLIRDSDIQLGCHARHRQLTLSEVEACNATVKQSEPSVPISQESCLPEAVAPSHAAKVLTTTQDDHEIQSRHLKKTASTAVSQETRSDSEIRLYASKSRLWHALAGHGPDFNKIKSLDFDCLSIIAEHGPKGILQHDLVRISGQDKRSLPSRTDRLCDDGYIEKKRVSVVLQETDRLLHTSKCTLKRFVDDASNQRMQTSESSPAPVLKVKGVRKKKKEKKVEKDRDSKSSSAMALESASGDTALPETRPIPLWTADRLITNQIFELVDRAGIKGMSMHDIRENLMGDRIRKPLDESVSRLVQSWQISQPLHIRHLSVVRDTILKGKTQIYMYYTYENYENLVERGTGFWEAVRTIPSKVKRGKNVAASLDSQPDVDEYGFPVLEESLFQGPHNDATLEECVSAFKIDPLHVTVNDPVLRRQLDGTYGVRYRNHQKQSDNHDNLINPNNAASTPSRAPSIEARATDLRKAGPCTPSSAIPSKSQLVEPKSIALPVSRQVLPKGQAVKHQVSSRKSVRNPDSRPLGRPRKYPKTGLPSNFDTMKPDEVELLLRSQEMFEKYELVKMEKQIVQRMESGEDAVIITYEVLAERDDSRKQEDELPVPIASRAQILHKFAGEPLPEPDQDEAEPKGRSRHDTRYRPSMAAHTYYMPASRKESPSESKRKDPQEMPAILLSRIRSRRQDVADLECKTYFPSIAAHTWPYIDPITSVVGTLTAGASQDSSKRRPGRPPKPRQLLDHRWKYLPSIAAHSGSYLPSESISVVRVGQKQKASAKEQLNDGKGHAIPHQYKHTPSVTANIGPSPPLNALHAVRTRQKRKRSTSISSQTRVNHKKFNTPSTATPEHRIIPAQEVAVGTSNMQHNERNEGNYPGWNRFMWKYYREQLENIPRSRASGIFSGETKPRRKRPCEPRGFRPAHFKLIVFKSSRLKGFDWFAEEPKASKQELCSGSRDQTPASQVPEPEPVSSIESASEAPPDLSGLISLPQPDPCTSAFQRTSTYISPYVNDPRKTIRRTSSPRPTRGVVQSHHRTTSLQSRQSLPRTEINEPISDPSTLPKTAMPASGSHHVHEDSIEESHAPARTLKEQPEMNGSSESTSLIPIGNHLNTMQSKITTSQVEQQPQSSTQKAKEPSEEHRISKFSRLGGSTAMLRKNIVMGIVERCEGVFPSHREMSSPFAAEWKRRGQEGTPEVKTISNAVDALIKEKKLRQITFTSRSKKGIIVTKSMLILPTIDIMDPRVIETQTKMAALHPRHFMPPAVMPPQECHNMDNCDDKTNNEQSSVEMTEEIAQEASALEAPELRQFHLGRRMRARKERAAMARLKAFKDQDQQVSGHTDGHEPSAKLFTQWDANNPALAAHGHGREIPPSAFPKSSGRRSGQRHVERLNSAMKPIPSLAVPLSSMLVKPVNNPVSLTWLPPNNAFSDFNFEGSKPATLLKAARNELQNDTREVPKLSGSSDKARHSIQEMTGNALRMERNQALTDSSKSSSLYTVFNPEPFAPPYTPTLQSPTPQESLTTKSAPEKSSQQRKQTFPSIQPRAAEFVLNRSVRSGDSETLNQMILLVSFMDPVHYFHRATGTFSVTFLGLRPPRKIFGYHGTASDPYAANEDKHPHDSCGRISGRLAPKKARQSKRRQFDEEVDTLLRRELEESKSNDVDLVGWPFVNHVFLHEHQTVSTIEADMDAVEQVSVRFKDGRLMSRPLFKKTRPKTGNSILSTGARGIDQTVAETRTPLKRRRLTSAVEPGTQDETSMELDHENRPTKFRRIRGPRHAKSLGENGEERLLTAVMVIRALTGGLDKRIDWVLVAKVFEPTYTQMFVHSRWNLTRHKYKLILPKMEADFHNIFASAYEDGTIPTLDYDNLELYDWKWLIEWTMANVDTPSKSLPELPVERSEMNRLYTLTETSDNDINEFYEIDGSSTLAKRIKVVHRDPYVIPLIREEQYARPAEGREDLDTVRSWIRANIITPEGTYNPSAARAKLSTFPERTIEDALKQLLLDRVLTQENKGRLVPGRNYDISDFFLTCLKKNLQPTHFHRAAAYKQQLDHEFEEKGFTSHSYVADDGDMVVIFNLLAHQRITLVPIGIPMNKWGHTDGSYETRQMDKRRLNFRIELRPSSTYIYGNPLAPLPAPPSRHLQDPTGKIPLWYDIHDSLVPIMWDMALAASLAVLAMRPGIGASELEKAMRPAMEVWELQEILEWLVCAKAAKQIGQGYIVEDEWWWLALGTGKCSGEPSDKGFRNREQRGEASGKGKGKETMEL